ncbi:hypothetical protein FHQ28_05415 [Pasteurellaceae bacterium USgator11]|nr:hypothetical protein FHQ19_09380 [Pasteurellaceae bacterium UScroc12]TNG94754.1 hypothetical protein FHQ20_08155 [Pasteurellaceae bacterium USgator41]TNG97725.1 hypothetical protein FHQ24_09945 [Pasteurellaceae bacterium UScroc31]TNH01686.1 hypothetical protein FHQ28_05415 [Pasteurellaceae bacterium USgator11]
MENQQQTFELIISTESKVLACNIADFEKKAEQFLSTLTTRFETDDDFGRAKDEVKLLKELEDKTRAAIKNAQQGDINQLITQAEAIAERFREARLDRDKLVKAKEDEIKRHITTTALDEIQAVQSNVESAVSLAMAQTMPKNTLQQRITEATKNKRTIDGLTKAVNAEKTLILAEIATEAARLKGRLNLIPISHDYLFSDAVKLIAGQDDLAAIVQERIAAEQQREAELKAKAEQEALAKAQAQQAAAVAETQKPQPTPTEPAQSAVQHHGFVIQITLPPMPQADAITIAREVKAFYEERYDVSLKPLKG